jgi:outer membrane protein assembly factor BamB
MNRRAVLLLVCFAGLAAAALLLARGARRARPSVASPARAALPPPAPPPPPLEPAPDPEAPRAFRMGPLHSGRSGFVLPRAPRLRARVPTGGRITTQAAVTLEGHVVFGSHDGIVYAADPLEGRVLWRSNTGDRIYASPLIAPSGTIYVGTDADRFLALGPTGTLQVALATDGDADTAPALAPDGSLRFAAGRTLYAVESDLTVRWRLEFGGKVFSSPAVLADGSTIVGCQDDGVYAVDPAGAVRWRFAAGDDVDAPPVVDEAGTVYIGSDDGHLYALAASDGSLRWLRALGGYVRAAAALGLDGSVVVGTYGPRPRIVALDRASGAERWSVPVAGPPTRDYGIASAALVDRTGSYAIGTPDDALLLLERDGTVRARLALPADVDAPPVLLADGVLAVGCDDGALHVFTD